MLPEELIKKVRLIEITTRKRVDDFMSGQFKSSFKGSGVQFSEHRLYVAGDDVRHIDWKVSARSREPVIKKFEEERELTVFLVVDVSASESFGSLGKLKSEVTAEIAGMLAYAAIHSGDKVGLLLFAGEVEKIIPPKKGRSHILRIIREILGFEPSAKPSPKGTNLTAALDGAGRIMKHSGVIFVLSDFLAEGYDLSLKKLSRRHDVVAVQVGDPRELEIPSVGQVLFTDPETGEEHLVDTSSYAFKKWFEDYRTEFETDMQTALKGSKTEWVRVLTDDHYIDTVVRFFRTRSRRKK